jgi:hypothetical protein
LQIFACLAMIWRGWHPENAADGSFELAAVGPAGSTNSEDFFQT